MHCLQLFSGILWGVFWGFFFLWFPLLCKEDIVDVKASARVQAGSSSNPILRSAYFPPNGPCEGNSPEVSAASRSSLCAPGCQPCQLRCRCGKTENELSLRGTRGPGSRPRLLWMWGGQGQRVTPHPLTLHVSFHARCSPRRKWKLCLTWSPAAPPLRQLPL